MKNYALLAFIVLLFGLESCVADYEFSKIHTSNSELIFKFIGDYPLDESSNKLSRFSRSIDNNSSLIKACISLENQDNKIETNTVPLKDGKAIIDVDNGKYYIRQCNVYVNDTLAYHLKGDLADSAIYVGNDTLSASLPVEEVPPYYFNWETDLYMPTPANQTPIPVPWVGQGSIASSYGIDVIKDIKYNDGWELVFSSFEKNSPGPLQNPYFILYNKYRGIMRIFTYITTQFVETSSYLQQGISIVSNQATNILNYLGSDFVDLRKNPTNYKQMQAAPFDGSMPLASNRWYMAQYELAYDPKIEQVNNNDMQLSWFMNYQDIDSLSLDGKLEGKIRTDIGTENNNSSLFDAIKTIKEVTGLGIISGIGKGFIDNCTINKETGENCLGLPNGIFKEISSGVASALSGAGKKLPGAVFNIFSSIIGGSSAGTSTPISLMFTSKIKLKGISKRWGSFPSSPVSIYMPGAKAIKQQTSHLFYNKPLGIFYLRSKPKVNGTGIHTIISYEHPIYGRAYRTATADDYTFKIPDNSGLIVYNPEILKYAKVEVVSQEVAARYFEYGGQIFVDGGGVYCGPDDPIISKLGIRFGIKITPKDGGPSSIIYKTFEADGILDWTTEETDLWDPNIN